MSARGTVWLIAVRENGAWRTLCVEGSSAAALHAKRMFGASGARVRMRKATCRVVYSLDGKA